MRRQYDVKYRNHTATCYSGDKLIIRDWNGKVVERDDNWAGADLKRMPANLRAAIDDYIRLAPYKYPDRANNMYLNGEWVPKKVVKS